MIVPDDVTDRATFQLGCEAFWDGEDASDNPYTAGTDQHATWYKGWNEAWHFEKENYWH